MAWTDERVELLKKMWGEGQSASQIAKELGGVTRNAVIGKVHRLGLSNRAGAGTGAAAKPEPAKAPKPEAKPKPAPKADTRPKSEPVPATEEPAVAKSATPARRQIIPAGQPLPPQPSANEISPEALAKVSEIEKKAKRLSLMELTERTCKWPRPRISGSAACRCSRANPIARRMSAWPFSRCPRAATVGASA